MTAILAMEDFEDRALDTPTIPPSLWHRYVGNTFTVLHPCFIAEFTRHIISIDPHIQFTIEQEVESHLSFLNTIVIRKKGALKVRVYRKPTHTDQHLNWDINHPLEHKRSVVRTLLRRADKLVSDPSNRDTGAQHVQSALRANGHNHCEFPIPRKQRR